LHIKEKALEMLLRTLYERNQMKLMVNFKEIVHGVMRAQVATFGKPHMVTVWSVEPTTKIFF
jgi:hypothetical protein